MDEHLIKTQVFLCQSPQQHVFGLCLGWKLLSRVQISLTRCPQGMLADSRADAAALQSAASQTAGLLPRDLCAVGADAAAAAVHPLLPWQAQATSRDGASAAREGVHVGSAEVDAALEAARKRTSAAIGAAQVRCLAVYGHDVMDGPPEDSAAPLHTPSKA